MGNSSRIFKLLSFVLLWYWGLLTIEGAREVSILWSLDTANLTVWIRPHDTVRWIWNDQLPHQVVTDNTTDNPAAFESSVLTGLGRIFEQKFDLAHYPLGVYKYHCSIHPTIMRNNYIVLSEPACREIETQAQCETLATYSCKWDPSYSDCVPRRTCINCFPRPSHSPSPSSTAASTPTISITSSQSVSSSITRTTSPTRSVTPTLSLSNSISPTTSFTSSITPSQGSASGSQTTSTPLSSPT